jgi:hypothetical protein
MKPAPYRTINWRSTANCSGARRPPKNVCKLRVWPSWRFLKLLNICSQKWMPVQSTCSFATGKCLFEETKCFPSTLPCLKAASARLSSLTTQFSTKRTRNLVFGFLTSRLSSICGRSSETRTPLSSELFKSRLGFRLLSKTCDFHRKSKRRWTGLIFKCCL